MFKKHDINSNINFLENVEVDEERDNDLDQVEDHSDEEASPTSHNNNVSVALNLTNISLQQLFDEQYIKQGDVLFYMRTFKSVKITYQCEVCIIISY
jgi:hypothetical protein